MITKTISKLSKVTPVDGSLLNCIPETSQNEKDFLNSFIDSTMQVSDVENFKCSVSLLSPL